MSGRRHCGKLRYNNMDGVESALNKRSISVENAIEFARDRRERGMIKNRGD